MNLLRVDPTGLKCLAEACESWSLEVAATRAPTAPNGSFQATAAAVGTINTETGSAANMLSARMLATAAGLSSGAAAHAAQDARSGATLDELAIGR